MKTIACDKCGHRMDHIPEKCPECEELIRGRMDPHVMERIRIKLLEDPPLWQILLFSFVLVFGTMAGFVIIGYLCSH